MVNQLLDASPPPASQEIKNVINSTKIVGPSVLGIGTRGTEILAMPTESGKGIWLTHEDPENPTETAISKFGDKVTIGMDVDPSEGIEITTDIRTSVAPQHAVINKEPDGHYIKNLSLNRTSIRPLEPCPPGHNSIPKGQWRYAPIGRASRIVLGKTAIPITQEGGIVYAAINGQKVKISEGSIMQLGREAKIPIPVESVSRNHASIMFVDGNIYVRDNGSKHGTIIDVLGESVQHNDIQPQAIIPRSKNGGIEIQPKRTVLEAFAKSRHWTGRGIYETIADTKSNQVGIVAGIGEISSAEASSRDVAEVVSNVLGRLSSNASIEATQQALKDALGGARALMNIRANKGNVAAEALIGKVITTPDSKKYFIYAHSGDTLLYSFSQGDKFPKTEVHSDTSGQYIITPNNSRVKIGVLEIPQGTTALAITSSEGKGVFANSSLGSLVEALADPKKNLQESVANLIDTATKRPDTPSLAVAVLRLHP